MRLFLIRSTKKPYPCPRIVCTSKIGNLFEQVGVPLGVGYGYGRFEVLGGWPPITPVVSVDL